MIGCMRTHVRKQPIMALYFEFETVLKFYNQEAWSGSFLFDKLLVFFFVCCWKYQFWKNSGDDKSMKITQHAES